jgi:hypothetical protein
MAAAMTAPSGLAQAQVARPNVLELAVDYAADSLIGEGERAFHGRLWRTPRALRHETREGGRPHVVVALIDRNLGWLVLPDMRVAIETDLSALDLPMDVLNGGGGLKQTRVGRERMNGLDTTKVRVERRAETGSRFDGFVWATDQGVIAKLEGQGESRGRRGRTAMSFWNVRIGGLDPALFNAPSGVQLVRVKGGDVGSMIEGLEAMGNLGRRR